MKKPFVERESSDEETRPHLFREVLIYAEPRSVSLWIDIHSIASVQWWTWSDEQVPFSYKRYDADISLNAMSPSSSFTCKNWSCKSTSKGRSFPSNANHRVCTNVFFISFLAWYWALPNLDRNEFSKFRILADRDALCCFRIWTELRNRAYFSEIWLAIFLSSYIFSSHHQTIWTVCFSLVLYERFRIGLFHESCNWHMLHEKSHFLFSTTAVLKL